jgi:hypothetical protein
MSGGNDAVATFGMELDSNLPDVAGNSARALEDLKDKITSDTNSLREMQKALRNLQGGTAVNISQFRDLKDKIAAQKASIAAATQSYLTLGGNFKDTGKKSVEAAKGFGSLTDAARAAPGPLSSLSGKLGSINSILAGGAMAAGLLLVAAAITAVTVAAVAGFAALARYGIGVADARRNELLQLEGLTKLRFGWFGLAGAMAPAADKASFLQSTIDGVSQSVALGRDQVAGYAEDLYRAGLRGGNLQAALKGVATTAAVQGEAAAGAFKGMAMSAALTGHSVKALADDVQARLGGIAAAQLLSLDVQSKKLHESFAMIFSGLKIDKLLEGLNSITSMFSQNAATGRALKALVDGLFGPLIDQVSGPASLLVKRFFQGMTIAALLLGITVLRLRNYFRATFGDTHILKSLDIMRVAVAAGAGVVLGFAAAVVIAGVALATFVGFVTAPIAGIVLLGVAIYQGIKALGRFISAAARVGADLVEGIIGGIKSGASGVISSLENLGSDAMAAFKKKLGIASPSRVAMRAAIEVPRGMAGGIRAGKPDVDRAMSSLVNIPNPTAGAPSGVAGSRGNGAQAGGSKSVHIGELHIHSDSAEPEALAAKVISIINGYFGEGLTALGAPVP